MNQKNVRKKLKMLFLKRCMCVYVCFVWKYACVQSARLCTACVPGVKGDQKRIIETLEEQEQTVLLSTQAISPSLKYLSLKL